MSTDTTTLTLEEVLSQLPKRHKVIFHNDDVTSFEYVVTVLMMVFSYSEEDAEKFASEVHFTGNAIAGVYDQSIAEMKVEQVNKFNFTYGKNLKVTNEPE